MEYIVEKGVDFSDYNYARYAACKFFNNHPCVECKRNNAKLAVVLKWKVGGGKHKQKTYYFSPMY